MLAVLAIALIGPSPVLAADPRAQELERRTREQLELEQRLRLLERSGVSSSKRLPAPSPAASLESCWQVQGLRLAGNTLISQGLISARLQPLMSNCMSASHINQLLATLTALYVEDRKSVV